MLCILIAGCGLQAEFSMYKNYRFVCSAFSVFVLFFALYVLTGQRGVSWQDSGEFQYRLLAGDYYWNSGIARAHPLYILLGRGFVSLFPCAMKMYACSMFSGLCMALALSVLFLVVKRVTSSVTAACVASLTAGFSHMAWWMSTVAEVYSLSLFFIMGELVLLYLYSQRKTARYLVLLFAVNGLHFSVHNVALLALPVYGILLILYLLKDVKGNFRCFVLIPICWAVAGSMIWWQAFGLLKNGVELTDVCASVLFGKGYFSHVTGVGKFNLSLFLSNMALAAVSFVSPCWLLAPLGFFSYKKLGNALFFKVLIALTLIHFLFWVRYFVPDQATFILPLLGLLSVWCGIGCASIMKNFNSERFLVGVVCMGVLLNICLLYVAPTVAQDLVGEVKRSRVPPGRDEWSYWLRPWKHNERSAQGFVENISKSLSTGDILYADSTTAAPLMAAAQLQPDACAFELLSPWTEMDRESLGRAIPAGKFYVVSPVNGYAPEWLLDGNYDFRKHNVVNRVLKTE